MSCGYFVCSVPVVPPGGSIRFPMRWNPNPRNFLSEPVETVVHRGLDFLRLFAHVLNNDPGVVHEHQRGGDKDELHTEIALIRDAHHAQHRADH